MVRAKLPDAVIILAADNDQWTLKPMENPGVHYAMAAAKAVGGIPAIPQFKDISSKPTDFNDLRAAEGLAEVIRQIDQALQPDRVEPAEPAPPARAADEEPPPGDPGDYAGQPDYSEPEPARRPRAATNDSGAGQDYDETEEDAGVAKNPHFTIKGHDRDRIYVFQHEMKMIVSRGIADWGEGALTAIANRTWRQMSFRDAGKEWKAMAMNAIQRIAFKRGYFDPSMRRGRGAWLDERRSVYHLGDRLLVGGVETDLSGIKSRFVYEQSRKMPPPAVQPLSNAEGLRIVEMFKRFLWKIPVSAALAAGFVALAPLCGALDWRPHIWLTGGAGSGKTTILNFINFLMAGTSVSGRNCAAMRCRCCSTRPSRTMTASGRGSRTCCPSCARPARRAAQSH